MMVRWILFVWDNARTVLILWVIVVLGALLALKSLNVEAFPDPSPPIVEVVAIYPGRSAEEVEKLITLPLEIAFSGMRGLERINSISLYSLCDIKLKFSYDIPYREARQEVINRLSTVSLPDNVQPQIIPNPLGEVMRYVVEGPADLMTLRTIQDWVVARYIKTAYGVEDVASYGGFIKAYVVDLIPEKMLAYGVSFQDVVNALSRSNSSAGGVPTQIGKQQLVVLGSGLIKSLDDIKKVVVGLKGNVPITLDQVAYVRVGNLPRTGIVGLNRKDDVVMGVVILRKDAKSIPAIRSIREKIEQLNKYILPSGFRVIPFYERGKLVDEVIHKVTWIALEGILLVFVTTLLLLGSWVSALAVALTVPISLVVALGVLSLQGESVNFLSIAAIDFGIIADIPILFMENYLRIRGSKPAGLSALTKSTVEVGPLLILSLLFILIAFIPVFLMSGAERQIFFPMVKTYLLAIGTCLILTFTFLIAVLRFFAKKDSLKSPFFWIYLENLYEKVLRKLLSTKHTLWLVMIGLLAILTVVLMMRTGFEFIPTMDEGNIYMRVIFPYSISLEQTYENAKRIRDLLLTVPEIKTVEFQVGRPEDGTDPTGPFNSEYFIDLKPYSQWRDGLNKKDLEEEIRQKVASLFPYADISVSQYIQDNLAEAMSGVKGENSLKIFGDDLYTLDKLAMQAKSLLQKVDGLEEVGVFRELGQPYLRIEVDRQRASSYGINAQDVTDLVAAALGGKEVTQVMEGDKRFSLLVSLPEEYRNNIEKIKNIPLFTPSGYSVPLSSVADIKLTEGPSFIYRENYKRYIPIKFDISSKDKVGTVRKAQELLSKYLHLPEGYRLEWSGQWEEFVKFVKRLSLSGSVALFLLLLLLFSYLRSIKNALLVMVGVLMAAFGSVLSLYVAGITVNVSAMVGFVSILGITLLNISIMMNHYHQLLKLGMEKEEACITTAKEKLRSVVLSGFVASAGLLPSALSHGVGTQIQKPLAVVVVGGMLVTTFLTLTLVPPLLKLSDAQG
ncbi:acriflavin resistance protein [Thermocrinis albus DSM 14484]|uniref:Acriflavin resistance protein n=1 Tax=Thermocrinis albus (strain DSM 14484 / JCM 11386 / HI 11/12) TaxID=638303 RepID=D3SMF3_THEAH|nr:CusA/CzcA family heavy metal efflux RND transporter [Thermocrinis albus]ADC89933.1 acriflavin resistance protein [Thermocrinis albus DSM 14484]